MSTQGPWSGPTEGFSFSVTTNVGDHLAYNSYFRSLPERRQARLQGAMVAAAVAPVLALVLCAIMALGLAGGACDLDDAFGSGGRGMIFGKVLAAILACEAVIAAIIVATRPRWVEASVRRNLARRPHVDAADPALRELIDMVMDDSGFRWETPDISYGFTWAVVRRFDETADHMILMTEPRQGFIVPKRDLPPGTILAIRDLAHAKLDRR